MAVRHDGIDGPVPQWPTTVLLCRGRRHREEASRTRTCRGGSSQGRVFGDAGPRTAQPPRADPQCPVHSRNPNKSCGWSRARDARNDVPPSAAHGPSARRLARRLRVTHGTIRLQKEYLDASEVLARAIETARPSIDARCHCLRVEMKPGPHPLHGDLARLVQVVSNLLINAAKYTPNGGEIVLTLRREGNNLVIRVWDNGDGIHPELLPQLFEPFSQGVRTLARSEGGLGLGLSLVRSLTELHGGTVRGTSDGPGRGSEFEVQLPLACACALDAASTEKTATRTPSASLRILVVDDNRDAADSLVLLLQLHGHIAEAVYDGPSGLDAARQNPPDLLFLDIGLPGMNGYAVARALRTTPEAAATRIVALSGYAQEEDQKRSRAAGFDDHLAKPLDPAILARYLNSFPVAQPVT